MGLRLSDGPFGAALGDQVWPAVDGAATLLVPLGATEQHGPHLPLATDTLIAAELARAAAAAWSGPGVVVVAPPLPYGASGEHQSFPGTLSIGTEALELLLVELVRSATETFPRVVLVNGHGGNHAAVAAAVRRLRGEGRDVRAWHPRIPGGDAHAGRTETSLLLAIAPELVRGEAAAAGNTAPLGDLLGPMRAGGVQSVSANGVLGDPAGANVQEGAELRALLVASLLDELRDVLRDEPRDPRRTGEA